MLAWCWIMHVYVIPQLLWSQCDFHQLSCTSCKPWVQLSRITLGSRRQLPKAQEKRMLRADMGPGYLSNSLALFLLEWCIDQRMESMLSWCNHVILRDLTSLSCSRIRIRRLWSSTPGTWMSLRLPVVPVELTFFSAEFLGSQDVANAEFLGGLRIMLFLFTCFLFLILCALN